MFIILLVAFDPHPTELFCAYFQPLEVVDRGSETQPQMVENLNTGKDQEDERWCSIIRGSCTILERDSISIWSIEN